MAVYKDNNGTWYISVRYVNWKGEHARKVKQTICMAVEGICSYISKMFLSCRCASNDSVSLESARSVRIYIKYDVICILDRIGIVKYYEMC